ncbi:phosphatase PAP2 family protein [Neorhizobium sp. LjRoot104]|uniref:phosphatase PAP2 family protein n=1 Tax=Neorhizobium sp. LjRoot104 TaxID=3342254 RepID=UPI003ED148F3
MYQFLSHWIDLPVVDALQKLSHHSEIADAVLVKILTRPTFKMFPYVIFAMYIFFCTRDDRKNAFICNLIIGAILTMASSRLLQDFLPARPRPLHANIPDFVPPFGIGDEILKDWSSFPSDTVALAMAMATAIFLHSRRLGVLFFIWSIAIVGFPRMYAGFHYMTDVVGGAFLGVVGTLLVDKLLRKHLVKMLRYSLANHFWVTNVALILFLFQAATMFDDLRSSSSELGRAIKQDYLKIAHGYDDITVSARHN